MVIKAIIKFINSTKNHQALPCFSSQTNVSNHIYLTKPIQKSSKGGVSSLLKISIAIKCFRSKKKIF